MIKVIKIPIKPFKGEIHDWCRLIHSNGDTVIVGRPVGHPQFSGWMRTSPVEVITVGFCVTQNSCYRLVGDELTLIESITAIKRHMQKKKEK